MKDEFVQGSSIRWEWDTGFVDGCAWNVMQDYSWWV